MTIGTSAIWGAKLSRSPLYDISVSWIKFEKTCCADCNLMDGLSASPSVNGYDIAIIQA
jgi:hypothetical protein